MPHHRLLVVIFLLTWAGCPSLLAADSAPAEKPSAPLIEAPAGEESKDKDAGKKGGSKKAPKALFEWAIGEKSDDDKKENGEQQEEDKPIDTDRPDFGAATTTVGRGRAVLETGFTFFHDESRGSRFTGYTGPDAVLRLGLFTDWFEFRIGQSYADFKTTPTAGAGLFGEPEEQHGFQDLYLGVKLALTEQQKCLPETAIIFQSNVPTGAKSLTAGEPLPGVIYLFSWELIEDRLSLSGLLEADRVIDGSDHYYVQLAHGMNLKYAWTRRFRTFLEGLVLAPAGAIDPDVGPQLYIHPGMLYYVTDNIQIDAHLFIGLNDHAIDFFGGPGLSLRY